MMNEHGETANLQRLTVKQVARVFGISERSIYEARKLLLTGRKDLIEKAESGEISLNKALILAGVKAKPANGKPLFKAWEKATEAERNEFLDSLANSIDKVKGE